jgi:sugar phosphate permease
VTTTEEIGTARRWSMLGVSLTATLCANVFINAIPFLIPALVAQRGISMGEAGLLASMPNFGMVVTLIAWGYALDRAGERIVLTIGLALTAAAAFAAASVDSMVAVAVFLFLGGMAAASTLAASGRLVTGWFPPERRGVAMGIRQTAQPLGIAVGALVLPELGKHNFSVALFFPAAACAVSALATAVAVRDPPRLTSVAADDEEPDNPYLETSALWRIHLGSMLLMVPQPVVLTFMLVWSMSEHGLSIFWAGALLGGSQLLGALCRTAAGHWSDRIDSRMRPLRAIAAATALVMVVLAITDHLGWGIAVAVMAIASAITGDNGLPFIAVPEIAGPFWSGRALGTQNTAERLVVAVAPPVFGTMIGAAGYPLAFAVCGVFPLAAVPFLPVRSRATAMSAADPRPRR